DEVLGRSPAELGLATAAESRRLEEALRQGGLVQGFRTQLRGSDGAMRDISIAAAPFEWDGQPVAVFTMRDITEAERARLTADAILDNASVGIALVRQSCFERVNPQFERIFGLQIGSLSGRSTAVMFAEPAEHATFAARAQQSHEAGRPIDIEREVPRPDGRVIRVRLRARAVDPERLQQAGTIWVAEDVTERHRVAQELALAKQQAEAANDAKSAFLATMSHEIRTPLNGVLGLARLLQDEGLTPRQHSEYLGHLVTAAEQLTGIVSDVLDLSKIEAGALDLERVPFDLHHLVQSTFESFSPLGVERGLAMRCDIAPEVPRRVKGDPVRVRQILANYLGNALKFTLRGGITVSASVPASGRLRLAVEDTGVGVDPQQQPRLFRPFVQADGSTTRRFGGTGLGLSICRELAERMAGTVGVQSDGRRGSVFWAEIALGPDAASAAPAESTGAAG
ncbi:MAG: ATP-binding protein, partial [Rubrivivax sp.]